MLTGNERLVLATCDSLAGAGDGFVLDSDIATWTGMDLGLVRVCLLGLGRGGFLDVARLGDNGLKVSVTPKGRQELVTDRRDAGTPALVPNQGSLARIIPRGVQALDEQDADIFLQLLPDYEGGSKLPNSVAFWMNRIEGTDPNRTFRVGVVYGLSGSGKSSLVKAGLLPRLGSHVLKVFLTANDQDTEKRLLAALRLRSPQLPQDKGLGETLAALSRGEGLAQGEKNLIVLDQFEQWLLEWQREGVSELAIGLRFCDGIRVQAMLLVRDDYLPGAIELLKSLGSDFKFDTDRNSRRVESFTREHARDVLIAYGRGCKKIQNDPSPEQEQFLEAALDGLQSERKYLPVRLALFAQVFKGRDWTVAELNRVGGAEGVGVAFFEENFGTQDADPRYRRHLRAVQPVLKALIPDSLSGIKGSMRSYSELRKASGYDSRPSEFEDLIHILDGELHLITPAEPEVDKEGLTEPGEKSYQLTHDFLVPSVQEWLIRKQKETRRGRAELLLDARESLWSVKQENRYLPSTIEWIRIRLLTKKPDWTERQRRMMRQAGRVHGLRGIVALLLLVVGTMAGLEVRRRVLEGQQSTYATELVQRLLDPKTNTAQVPDIILALRHHRRWVGRRIREEFERATEDSSSKLHASLALLPIDDNQVEYLFRRLLKASSTDLPVLRDALMPYRTRLTPRLWSILKSIKPDDPRLLPVASALAFYEPTSPRWTDKLGDEDLEVRDKVSLALLGVDPVFLGNWVDSLRPLSKELNVSLSKIYFSSLTGPYTEAFKNEQDQAASILADYARDDPGLLADLLLESEGRSFDILFKCLRASRKTIELLESRFNDAMGAYSEADRDDERDHLAQRQSRAVVAMVRLGRSGELWRRLIHSPDPTVRSYLVEKLRRAELDLGALSSTLENLAQVAVPIPKREDEHMDAILFHAETSARRALILILGNYDSEDLPSADRERLVVKLHELYRNDPDAGVHGAAEWTLLRWGQRELLAKAIAELQELEDRGKRRWYVNCEGDTMAIINGTVSSQIGSPENEPNRDSDEVLHSERIDRCFAIATKEVSVDQYLGFIVADRKHLEHEPEWGIVKRSRDSQGPQVGVSWYDAAAYCNWLSKREGLDKSQWCYEPNKEGKYAEGMKIIPDFCERSGYRLPTEAEWEYACRAGTVTSRYYGVSEELLTEYACYENNSIGRTWPCGKVKPNDLGIFDVLGNINEWCQDRYSKDYSEKTVGFELSDKFAHVLRSGSFSDSLTFVRSANRNWDQPKGRSHYNGFRLCRTLR